MDNNFKELFIRKVIKNFNISKDELYLIKKALDFFIVSWERGIYKDKTHDFLHVIKVLDYSIYILKREKIKLNKKESLNLLISIVFHDIGLFFAKKPNEIEKSIELFLRFYEGLNKKEKKIIDKNLVIKLIKEHSFSKSKDQSNLISKILYDADKLDALGVRGFYRVLVYDKDRFLLNPVIDYNYYLSLLKKGLLSRKKCSKIFNDKIYILDHFFLKIFWIKERLNFDSSKKLAKLLEKEIIYLIEKLTKNLEN